MRLFVGIDLPDAVANALASACPRSASGINCVHPDDLHLTLHFVGAADADQVETALEDVRAPGFALEVAGLGQFRMRGGRRILWAGVVPEPQLVGLHRRVGIALASTGFRPETRPYLPHVTLARVRRESDPVPIDALLGQNEHTRFGTFDVNRFVLYDSNDAAGDARYRRLRTYPLGPEAGAVDTG